MQRSKDPKGLRTLRLCMSWQKFKIGAVKQTKNLSKHNCQKKMDGKNYYCPKNLDGKNHYHPRILTNHKKVVSSRISFSLKFWSLVRNDDYYERMVELYFLSRMNNFTSFNFSSTISWAFLKICSVFSLSKLLSG